ncbi:brain protein I3-like isoform X2 [Anneissia japonica]|uniref:brain protein I3-like isoform X2 n=1 Tax=Anneissia japonica TaxID=1529436 RepID=UPI0014254E8F|nr:brain protein I3-like isoform X2 [Anneissia japonica]
MEKAPPPPYTPSRSNSVTPGYPPPQPGYPPPQPMYAYPPPQPAPPPQPMIVNVTNQQQVSSTVNTGRRRDGNCPRCRVSDLEESYTILGLCCAIVFFPLGVLCCHYILKEKKCPHCGAVNP